MEKRDTRKFLRVGDMIPLEHADKSGTFHAVTIQGKRYLVDDQGRIVLAPDDTKVAGKPQPATADEVPAAGPARPYKFWVKPGTPEFSRAVQEASSVIESFLDLLRRYYRRLAPSFEMYVSQSRDPYLRYFERDKEHLANLQAHLVRVFFSRTKLGERGLDVFEFLTTFLARKLDGEFRHDRGLTADQQNFLVRDFLNMLSRLGRTPVLQRMIAKAFRDFINQEFQLMEGEGGVGFYVTSSLQQALEHQKYFLMNQATQTALDVSYQRLMRQQGNLYVDNILAYLKALAIVRFFAYSSKEERGRDDREREEFLYQIFSYAPGWYK